MSVVPFDGANLIEYKRSSIDENHINEDIPKIFEKFSNRSDGKKGKFELSCIYRCRIMMPMRVTENENGNEKSELVKDRKPIFVHKVSVHD